MEGATSCKGRCILASDSHTSADANLALNIRERHGGRRNAMSLGDRERQQFDAVRLSLEASPPPVHQLH